MSNTNGGEASGVITGPHSGGPSHLRYPPSSPRPSRGRISPLRNTEQHRCAHKQVDRSWWSTKSLVHGLYAKYRASQLDARCNSIMMEINAALCCVRFWITYGEVLYARWRWGLFVLSTIFFGRFWEEIYMLLEWKRYIRDMLRFNYDENKYGCWLWTGISRWFFEMVFWNMCVCVMLRNEFNNSLDQKWEWVEFWNWFSFRR